MTTVTAPVDVKVSAASTAGDLIELRAILGEAVFWTSQKKDGIIPSSRKAPEDSGPNRFLHLCLRSLYPERFTLLPASFRPTSQPAALGGDPRPSSCPKPNATVFDRYRWVSIFFLFGESREDDRIFRKAG